MNFKGKLTRRGAQLRAMALAGEATLIYTRAAAGSGLTPQTATSLDAEQQTLPLSVPRYTTSGIILPATLTAALADKSYTLTEVGVYVQDGAAETLYSIFRGDTTVDISPDSSMSIRFSLEEAWDETTLVNVSPAGIITEPDLESMMGAPDGLATLDAAAVVPVGQLPYSYGTEDLQAGVTELESGKLYFVYE